MPTPTAPAPATREATQTETATEAAAGTDALTVVAGIRRSSGLPDAERNAYLGAMSDSGVHLNSSVGMLNFVPDTRPLADTKEGLQSPSFLTAFDMFSGCGGLTEGLKDARFKVIGAVEIDEFAAENYRLNHPEVELWRCDVRELSTNGVMKKLNLEKGQLDLLAGCPPCQGFSTLRTRNGALKKDKRNTLLKEFLRFAEDLLPKAIMLENVPGLESYWLFKPFCERLKELGYLGKSKIIDAADYSVPQRRKRLIYLAGFGRTMPFASAQLNRVTVREKIGSLPTPGRSGDAVHDLPENRTKLVQFRIASIPKDGGSRSQLPAHEQLNCHKKCDGFKDVYGRMSWDKIAPTITGGCFNPSKGRFLHPDQDRAITMREASLLQGFPPNYKFLAKRGKVALALMIGNALPPPFIQAHAKVLANALEVISDA